MEREFVRKITFDRQYPKVAIPMAIWNMMKNVEYIRLIFDEKSCEITLTPIIKTRLNNE